MANAAKMAERRAVRAMVVGFPKSGKTGSLCSLIDAGFKVRVLDFDGNTEPLFAYVKDASKLANVDIVRLEDDTKAGNTGPSVRGKPEAYVAGYRLMDHWKYTDEDGEEVDLGMPKNWGPDTILVLDTLTSMGDACMRNVISRNGRQIATLNDQYAAQNDQDAFIDKLTSAKHRFHVVALSHLKLVGARDVAPGDSELTKDLKERAAEHTPTRYYPSALGKQLPPLIGRHFPTILLAENKVARNGTVTQTLSAIPRNDLDLGAPAVDLPSDMTIKDGLLTVFEKLTSGVEWCLDPANNPDVQEKSNV